MDTDFWWHTEYAKHLFNHWSIAETDWMSWNHEGKPYLITQWLGQMLIGAPYIFGGPSASSAATALVCGAIVFFAWRTAKLFAAHAICAFLAAFVSAIPVLTIVARPQIYGILAFSILIWLVNAWQEKKDRRTLLAIPALMALWANLHGSYVVGLIYLVVFMGALIFELVLNNKFSWHNLAQRHGALALACSVAVVATLANPHGIHAWEYVVTISRFETTNSGVIGEWVPTSTEAPLGQFFFIVVAAAVAGLATTHELPSARLTAVFIWALFFGLAAVRQVYFATLAMTPLMATIMRSTRISQLIAAQIPDKAKLSTAIATLACATFLTWPIHRATAITTDQASNIAFPIQAMTFIDRNRIEGRLLNEATAGGWTIANTGRKVFIDGRLDLYGDKYFFDWYFARGGLPGWRTFLKEHDPQVFVIRNVAPLRQLLLLDGGYALIHEDDWYSVLVKREPQYLEIIKAHEREPAPFYSLDTNGHVRPGWKGW